LIKYLVNMSEEKEHEGEKPKHEDSDKESQMDEIFKKKHHYTATVAAVFFIIGFLVSPFSGISGFLVGDVPGEGEILSPQEAGEMMVNTLNEKVVQDGGITLLRVEEEQDFYIVITSYQGAEVPIYVSKNGEYWFQSAIKLEDIPDPAEQPETQPQPSGVPKSDKPVVDLFIWSYCPYGVSAQGPMSDVAKLFGDKAEFNAIMYHDGHGAYETQQNKIQACIQEIDKDNYWDYAGRFVAEVYPACASSRDVECDKTESVKLMNSLGIDSDAVMSCVDSEGAALIAGDRQYAGSLGVTGSPTIVINGVKVQSARTAEAFKSSICQAFNTPPEECGEQLSAAAAATSGSC
jgi:hypothetical protein